VITTSPAIYEETSWRRRLARAVWAIVIRNQPARAIASLAAYAIATLDKMH
jgi:hypothetical protein